MRPHPWNTSEAATVAAATEELDRFEAEVDSFLQTLEDGRLSVAETGALTVEVLRGGAPMTR